ncbi:MAG: ABC transporter permease [Anaerolineaceae bacterium]|nr:ABC transporter permease [Anaerolineaceae bacterium]MCY3935526.1 ABC transporter permease [Chloroflexota bacterium]MCY4009060.1 ABC transporter permease [Anaerolineaceae bacterium]MCY4106655.1 ABC transporter permease [Chloroflexota bacterium]
MLKYIYQRLLLLIPMLLGVSIFTFGLLQIVPGDPITGTFGLDVENMDDSQIERLREQMGLNDPIPVQYLRYLGRLLQGDFGRSISTRRPVSVDLVERYPATLLLALASLLIVVTISIPLGVISARYRNSWVDHIAMLVSLFGVSMPNFWVGIMLILIFALYIPVFPSFGMRSGIEGTFMSLVLPALTLGTSLAGFVTRLTRSSMLEVLSQDYMRTARAKGLTERASLIRHGLKNAFIPVITVLGLQFASLLSGSVVVERVFAWPGIGRFAVDAIARRDYPVIMGTVLIFATTFVFTNLILDILYVFFDPRIRYD